MCLLYSALQKFRLLTFFPLFSVPSVKLAHSGETSPLNTYFYFLILVFLCWPGVSIVIQPPVRISHPVFKLNRSCEGVQEGNSCSVTTLSHGAPCLGLAHLSKTTLRSDCASSQTLHQVETDVGHRDHGGQTGKDGRGWN